MTEGATRVVRDLFRAIEGHDRDGLLAAYHADVEIHEPAGLPYAGTYLGHEGALRHANAYLAAWGPYQSDSQSVGMSMQIEVADDERVVVSWRQRAMSGQAGRLDLPALSAYQLREGRIVRSQVYQDTGEVVRYLAAASGFGTDRATLQLTRVRVSDASAFAHYSEQSLALVEQHGGHLLAYSTSRPDVVEGEWPSGALFVHAWPSKARFREFYDSADYQAVCHLRTESSDTDLIVVDVASSEAL